MATLIVLGILGYLAGGWVAMVTMNNVVHSVVPAREITYGPEWKLLISYLLWPATVVDFIIYLIRRSIRGRKLQRDV